MPLEGKAVDAIDRGQAYPLGVRRSHRLGVHLCCAHILAATVVASPNKTAEATQPRLDVLHDQ